MSGGAGSESGVLHDAWFMGNDIHQLVNQSNEVRFGTDTYPSSRSNTAAASHFTISHFSAIDTIMTFSVENDLLQQGFPRDFGQSGTAYPPLYGDLDGDGQLEIVVVTDEGMVYAWNSDGTKVIPSQVLGYRKTLSGDSLFYPVAWAVDVGERVVAQPILGDIYGDGRDELFVATESGAISGYHYFDETFQKSWEWKEEMDMATFLLYKIEGRQVIIGTKGGRILAIGPQSEIFFDRNLESGSIVGICQYDRDHLIATTENGHIVQIDRYGQLKWNLSLEGEGLTVPVSYWSRSITSPTTLSVVSAGLGFFLDDSGAEVSRYGINVLPMMVSDGAMGDIDQDGYLEIIHTGAGQFWCFNHNGSLVDYYPFPQLEKNVILSSPVLGDVDGDGLIDVLAGSSSGHIEGYSTDGTILEGFPFTTGGSLASSPVIFDLDSDGDVEVMAVSDEGLIYVWDLSGGYEPDLVPWGSKFHDPAHTGLCDQKLESRPSLEEIMPTHLVYNYPNPAEGNFTTIRYRLERRADVHIRIFDLSGELVGEFPGPGEPQTENEVVWRLNDVVSGVYFCQVRATGIARENRVTIKIAVAK